MEKSLIFKYLYRSHTIIGLAVLFLFYLSTFFGTLTLFMPYIKVWESPSRHFVPSIEHAFNIDTLLENVLREHHFLGTKPIEITLPSFRDPLIKLSSEAQNSLYINPVSHEVFHLAKEENSLSLFFNELHTGVVIPLVGMPLMGIMSVGILFLSVGGVWLYFKKRKTQKPSKNRRIAWFSWHKIIGLSIIPYALIFSLTGAFLGLMLSTSKPYAWAMSDGKLSNMRQLVAPILFAQPKYPPSATSSQMLAFSELHAIAKEHYPTLQITNATLYHYGTKEAKVRFRGFDEENRALSGRINRLSITLDASSGAEVERKTLAESHTINQTLSLFYFLHFLPDETLALRLVVAFFGVIMGLSLLSGYLIWAKKKLHQKGVLADAFNRVSIALLMGLFPSSALVLFLHWFLPMELFDKEVWLRGAFYASLSFWLFYSMFERSIVGILSLLLKVSAWLFVGAVIFHGLKSGFFLWESLMQEAWVLFYVDVALLIIAGLLLYGARWVEKKELFYRYERQGVFNVY
ncbi:MAG: hypothetical protein EOM53_05595 [Alphaproteobacteria bacterium]|nr:hypothetical protein [Alphaproteobacteria bacterium]